MAERMVMFSLATLLHSFDGKLGEVLIKLDLEEKFGINCLEKEDSSCRQPYTKIISPSTLRVKK